MVLAQRLTFLKFFLVIGVPVVFVINNSGSIVVCLSNVSIVDSIKHFFNLFRSLKLVKTLHDVKMRPFMTEAHSQPSLAMLNETFSLIFKHRVIYSTHPSIKQDWKFSIYTREPNKIIFLLRQFQLFSKLHPKEVASTCLEILVLTAN